MLLIERKQEILVLHAELHLHQQRNEMMPDGSDASLFLLYDLKRVSSEYVNLKGRKKERKEEQILQTGELT